MGELLGAQPRRRIVEVATGAGIGVLALLAVRADLDAPAVEGWQVAADVIVGLAFVVAGRFCPAPSVARGLLIGVGAAWLLGSFVPDARLWHQSVLAVFLVTFPTGRARSVGQRVVVALAFLAMLVPLSQVLAAALFGAVVVAVILEPRDIGTARAFPIAAAAAVALVLCGSWNAARSSPESFDPVVAVSVYETVLLAVAAAVPFAVRVGLERRSRLVDRFLSDQRLVGLAGLEALLRDAAGDPTIRVHRWQAEEARYVAGDGSSSVGPSPGRRWLPIADDGVPVAAVELASSALDDESTATAVASAVRLALANLDLQDELDEQLATLEAARGRLVAAGDDQREATAARLRHEVLEPLDEAASDLRALAATVHDAETADALAVVVDELTAATAEIGDHVAGVPATRLGSGRLVEALESLATGCPVPAEVDATAGWAASPPAEAALFYACSEALANVVKHASASHVSVSLRRSGGEVFVTVVDDGVGGADSVGSGLQVFADRLASRGGRLRVVSPPGAGTALTATVVG